MPIYDTNPRPSLPNGLGSNAPSTSQGTRVTAFTYLAGANKFIWAVPPGVSNLVVYVFGGGGNPTNAGGSSSFGNYATSTGGSSADGTSTVTNTNQNYAFHAVVSQIFTNYGGGPFAGGRCVVYLNNMQPGTMVPITVGAGGAAATCYAAGTAGLVLVEY